MIRQYWQMPFFNQEGEGGSGSGGEGRATGEETGGGNLNPGDGSGEGGSDGDGSSAGSSLLDFAPKGGEGEGSGGQEGDGGEAWKLPDGIEVPEHLLGANAEETLRKVSAAYKGARQEISTKKKEDGVLEGDVPGKIDGYTFDAVGTDPKSDAVLADLMSEESQQYLDPAREAALDLGIPDATFAKFMHTYVSKLNEAGIAISGDPAAMAQVSGEAEMEQLTSDLGAAGADLALRQVDTYAVKLAENGILQSQDDVNEFAQMVGTAKGLQIFQRILVAEFGEQAIPPGDGVEGAMTPDEAHQKLSEALRLPVGPDREAAIHRAEANLEKANANYSSTRGSVRSRVL